MTRKKSPLEIKLGILQAIKRGREDGEKVGPWYIQRDLELASSTFRKYMGSLKKDDFIREEGGEYSLTKKAEDIVGYFKKIDKLSSDPEESFPLLGKIPKDNTFKPVKIIRRIREKKPGKIIRRTKEQLKVEFLSELEKTGYKGLVPFRLGNAINASYHAIRKIGEELKNDGLVTEAIEEKYGKVFRTYHITESGIEWKNEPDRTERMFIKNCKRYYEN